MPVRFPECHTRSREVIKQTETDLWALREFGYLKFRPIPKNLFQKAYNHAQFLRSEYERLLKEYLKTKKVSKIRKASQDPYYLALQKLKISYLYLESNGLHFMGLEKVPESFIKAIEKEMKDSENLLKVLLEMQ